MPESSYLLNLKSQVSPVTIFTPDYKFLAGVQSTLESRYTMNYDALSRKYGMLKYSPLTKDETTKDRNDFFNAYENKIRNITDLDLSRPENVDIASKLFDPLVNNDLFVKDMTYTKQAIQAMNMHETFLNCLTPDNCGGFSSSDESLKAIQYKLLDFKNASKDEAMAMKAPTYIPKLDTPSYIAKKFKDAGYKIKNVSVSPTGQFIITDTNGKDVSSVFSAMAHSYLKNDGMVQAFFNQKAYVLRKDLEMNYQGDDAGFIEAYTKELGKAENYINGFKSDLNFKQQVNSKTEDIGKSILDASLKQHEKGKPMTPEEKETYKTILNGLEYLKSVSDGLSKIEIPVYNIDKGNILKKAIMKGRFDGLLSEAYLAKESATAGLNYALATHETEIKESQAYLEDLRFKHDYALETYKANLDKDKELFKAKLKTSVATNVYKNLLNLAPNSTTIVADSEVSEKELSNEDKERILHTNNQKNINVLKDVSEDGLMKISKNILGDTPDPYSKKLSAVYLLLTSVKNGVIPVIDNNNKIYRYMNGTVVSNLNLDNDTVESLKNYFNDAKISYKSVSYTDDLSYNNNMYLDNKPSNINTAWKQYSALNAITKNGEAFYKESALGYIPNFTDQSTLNTIISKSNTTFNSMSSVDAPENLKTYLMEKMPEIINLASQQSSQVEKINSILKSDSNEDLNLGLNLVNQNFYQIVKTKDNKSYLVYVNSNTLLKNNNILNSSSGVSTMDKENTTKTISGFSYIPIDKINTEQLRNVEIAELLRIQEGNKEIYQTK